MGSRSFILLLALSFGFGRLKAQEAWTARASGTGERLWAIAHGDGLFVAVGDHGSILTSRDTENWKTQSAGTAAALLAVTHVWGQFVAVGDGATVLVSKDGVAWRMIETVAGPEGAAGTFLPRRLNAVGATADPWNGELSDLAAVSAAGEDGVAVWGHPIDRQWGGVTRPGAGWIRGIARGKGREVRVGQDGILLVPVWSGTATDGSNHVATPLSPRKSANLEAVLFAREQFVAVGQRGAVLVSNDAIAWTEPPPISTAHIFGLAFFNDEFVSVGDGGAVFRSPDGREWTPAVSGVSAALRGAAASATALVAVGDNGVIVSSGVAPKRIVIREQPAAATTNVGGAAGFRVVASGSLPLSYQWFRDGEAIAGATAAALGLHPVAAAQAGSYRVEVKNAAGSMSSAVAALVVQPPPAKPIVSDSFRADATLRGTPTVILPLADGRVVVAVTNPGNETIDPFAAEVVRLLSDGRIDPTFHRAGVAAAEFAWRPTFYRPEVRQLLLQPDGRVLVTGYFGSYDGVTVSGMVRLLPDGTVDASFRAAIVPPGRPRTDSDFVAYVPIAALQPNGRIIYITPRGEVMRLLVSGEADPSFQAPSNSFGARTLAVNASGRIFVGTGFVRDGASGSVSALLDDGRADPSFPRYSCSPVDRLYATSEGGVLVGTWWDSGPIFPGDTRRTRFPTKTFRIAANGSLDAALPTRDLALAAPPAPDGSLLLADGRMVKPDGVTEWRPNFGAGYDYHVRVQQFAPDGRLWLGGDFTVYNGTPTHGVALLNVDALEQLSPPRILAASIDPTISSKDFMTFRVVAIAPGPVTFSLLMYPGNLVASVSAPELSRPRSDGTFSMQVSNSAGVATSDYMPVPKATGDARVVRQADRVSLTPGRYNEAFWVELSPGFQPVRTEWWRNGVRVDGPPGGIVGASQAGTYMATFTDVFGNTVRTEPILVTVEDVSRFTNLSTRAPVGASEQAAILGFTVPSGSWREFVLRGVGPGLARFGVEAPLPAARLEVFRADGGLLMRTNTDDSFDDGRIGAFPLSSTGGDAAVRISLGPGTYTARLSGIGAATGAGLIELYETGNLASRISNLSSRVLVTPTPTGSAIAGFAIRGAVPKRVLVRAAGPALTALHVGNVLPNPKLEVRDESGRLLFENDDWGTQDATSVLAAAASVGAFPFATGSVDAALKVELPPGNYTAVISGSDGIGGVALVEVYELP